jgi:hypothetical protein
MGKRMSIEEYALRAADRLCGEYKEVEKANGIIKHGIVLPSDSEMHPTVYVDDAYENKVPYSSFVKEVQEGLRHFVPTKNPINDIADYDGFVKARLRARLYNRKTNAEVYISAAPYGFDDLIIIPYVQLDDNASVKVTDSLLKAWDKSGGEVIETALGNSREYNLTPLTEILEDMGFLIPDDAEVPVYVLTNGTKLFGAITAITQREMLKEKFKNGYKIIPSSVHEVLVISDDEADTEMAELANIIVSVNEEQVSPEERLGEHAYQF